MSFIAIMEALRVGIPGVIDIFKLLKEGKGEDAVARYKEREAEFDAEVVAIDGLLAEPITDGSDAGGGDG